MLTGDLVRPRLRKKGGTLGVEMVATGSPEWQHTAADLIKLFRAHAGKTMAAWDNALEVYEGDRVDYVVVRGLAKVLVDAGTFAPLETPVPPSEVRERLFARGPAFSRADLFNPHTRTDLIAMTAAEMGLAPEQLETALFADRPAEYRLIDAGPEWTAEELLARYNLELSRGVLYWASQMRIDVYDSYKDFWRYVKLFKLMFEASPKPDGGYSVLLDGPISPFVASTTRYGRQFAAFLPALFLCERWQMAATVRHGNGWFTYALNNTSPLRGYFKKSGMFDSRMEADFAAEFEAKFGGKRGQWLLSREDEVLLLADTVFIPDFALTHKQTGKRALVEIVGFWHRDYLRRKVEKVRAANRRNLILLVYEGTNLGAEKLQDIPSEVLYFPNKPVLKDVMAAVERCAE